MIDWHMRMRMVRSWPIAAEIDVSRNVRDQGKSGLVVLNVSFVARDPYRKSRLSTMEAQSRRNILNGKHLYRASSLSH
jgi:hypothetical protein